MLDHSWFSNSSWNRLDLDSVQVMFFFFTAIVFLNDHLVRKVHVEQHSSLGASLFSCHRWGTLWIGHQPLNCNMNFYI